MSNSNLGCYLDDLAPTPLVPIRIDPRDPVIWSKLEFLNPSGSTKDRIARHILALALKSGQVEPGGLVAEASSGSTSIAMALVCAQLGLRFTAVMPTGVSNERLLMIRALGGEIRLTPKEDGIAGAIAETERLGAFLPRQFHNPENANAHCYGTAPEILQQIPGHAVDAVVSGVGTGGTLVGLHRGCRAACAVLARPIELTGAPDVECCSFSARIPGVVDSVSTIFRPSEMPGLVTVEIHDQDALAMTRSLIRLGFPVGPSSGLNFCAALEYARRLNNPEARVVTVFPDRMERYFTTDLFRPYWQNE
jgi:cysteine synthase